MKRVRLRAQVRRPSVYRACALFGLLAGLASPASGQAPPGNVSPSSQGTVAPIAQPVGTPSATKAQRTNFHAQNTDIVQGDQGFYAKYSGSQSLSPKAQVQETVTGDLFFGALLPHDAEAHADLLTWQGFGLSGTHGIEAFPNGDAYKIGTHAPDFSFARLFIRRTIGLSGKQEDIPDGQLSLASRQDVSRLTLTAGRFSATDIFDNNSYAGDPHTQFMNWAFVANLTWDYPADALGFTDGVAVERNWPNCVVRYGAFLMPKVANSQTGDDELLTWPHAGAFGPPLRSWGMVSEIERPYTAGSHSGVIRLLAWLNEADMYSYQGAATILKAQGPGADISAAQAYRFKYGLGLNWEQEVAQNVGAFSRLGFNYGGVGPWAYTDANWSGSLGMSVSGAKWHRSGDTFGLAGVLSGVSSQNQAYLEAGGVGILDGDGALNYGDEGVIESYYDCKIGKSVHLTLDYQHVNDPAFNRARGPVSIFAGRLHEEF